MCKGIKPWPQFGNERAGGVFGGWCPVTLAPKERENSRGLWPICPGFRGRR